jgi:ribosomal protein S18 acetylase RimI-like enzyme
MKITVREAGIEDAEMISRLATETFYETYSWYNTKENMEMYTQTYFNPDQTRKELVDEGTWFLLAEDGAKAVGYAKLRNVENPPELQEKKHIEIERIYVAKSYQDKKVGYALIRKCIEKARKENLDVIWLGVWEKNEKAIAFYEKVGFEKFGTHNFLLGEDVQLDHLLKYELKQ